MDNENDFENNSENGSEDLDTSWIEKEERMFSTHENYLREQLKEIDMFYIYMNCDNAIVKVENEVEVLDDSGIISKERILQIIQTKRHLVDLGKKYKLVDILSFQVPLESDKLESFIKLQDIENNDSSNWFKTMDIFDEIVVVPSIFIFHDLTSLFFLFIEADNGLKSILRNGSGNAGLSSSARATKKVRITTDSSDDYIENKRKSMKRFMRKAKHTRKNVDK
jgi:hypothetical protein